jgi:chromosome segregation ATPase
LADVFSSILSDQCGRTGDLYDVDELVVLAELHEDVLATRDEKLVQAIDLVKSRVLHGKPFRAEDAQRSALELRKLLASSAGERERAGIGERERLRGEVLETASQLESERSRSNVLTDERQALVARVSGLQDEIHQLRAGDERTRVQLNDLQVALARSDRRALRNRVLLATLTGTATVFFNSQIAGTIPEGICNHE